MNLYKLFYEDYYNDNSIRYTHEGTEGASKYRSTFDIESKNVNIVECKLNTKHQEEISTLVPMSFFTLETLYPGLITGVGITHETRAIEGEFKLGIHLDYTSGMPVVYGSTIKGVLKSYFKDYADTVEIENPKRDAYDLQKEIFDGCSRADDGGVEVAPESRTYKSISQYKRDTFFDAVITEANRNNRIVDRDNLCPHGENPLVNPIPITFLKVASGVKMQFRFKLHDGIISAEKKMDLFKEIILDWGVGAKTNVGYGQFKEVK